MSRPGVEVRVDGAYKLSVNGLVARRPTKLRNLTLLEEIRI